jgi:acyl-CoA reductase-like NAD-dependent aldehyde dehydrogenase
MNTPAIVHLVTACREVQPRWAAESVRTRLRFVRRLRHALIADLDNLCAAVERDIGKPPGESLPGELFGLAAACRFLEKRAAGLLRPRKVPLGDRPLWLGGQHDWVHRRPRGVVGIMGTWNYPLFLNGVQIIQAVVAGNAVIWKPSEVAPTSADALWAWLQSADLPQDLVARLPATREAGPLLADAPIDHLVFTGHADTGRTLAAHLGRRLISSTLELSGCDAMFVLDDAVVDLAARAAWFGATLNRGQTCLAVRRVFVDRSLYEMFQAALEPLVKAATPVRLATPAQAQRAHDLIADALGHGARLLFPVSTGAPDDAIRPAVVVDARPDMALCRRDSFAPLLAVLPYDRLDDALAANRQCDYALGASVFTRTPARARALAADLPAGVVTINDVIAPTAHPATPFGGVRASGWGVTQGAEGLLDMTVPQVVSVRKGRWRPHYDPPGSTTMTDLATLRAVLAWQHAPTFWQRVKALIRLTWSSGRVR